MERGGFQAEEKTKSDGQGMALLLTERGTDGVGEAGS